MQLLTGSQCREFVQTVPTQNQSGCTSSSGAAEGKGEGGGRGGKKREGEGEGGGRGGRGREGEGEGGADDAQRPVFISVQSKILSMSVVGKGHIRCTLSLRGSPSGAFVFV